MPDKFTIKTIPDGWKGGRFTVKTALVVLPDEKWKAEVLIIQERTFDGKEWEKKEAFSSVIDDDGDRALARCNITINEYLRSVDFNLFSEKALEDAKDNGIKN